MLIDCLQLSQKDVQKLIYLILIQRNFSNNKTETALSQKRVSSRLITRGIQISLVSTLKIGSVAKREKPSSL